MERIFISHFSFSIAEQIQFWTITTPSNAHTHKQTPVLPSLTQTNKSSTFLLPAISSIFSQQTGSHYKSLAFISLEGSSKHCCTHCNVKIPNISTMHNHFQNCSWKIWLLQATKQEPNDQFFFFFLKRAGTLQQALLIELTQIHVVIIGNYLSISNVLMSLRCERQRNQELLA